MQTGLKVVCCPLYISALLVGLDGVKRPGGRAGDEHRRAVVATDEGKADSVRHAPHRLRLGMRKGDRGEANALRWLPHLNTTDSPHDQNGIST